MRTSRNLITNRLIRYHAAMQALNGWLRTVRAEGMVLVRTRVAGPWGFAVDPRDAAVFHFVVEGRGW